MYFQCQECFQWYPQGTLTQTPESYGCELVCPNCWEGVKCYMKEVGDIYINERDNDVPDAKRSRRQ